MILWHLRGIISEIVCSIEKQQDGYRLVVKRAEEIEHEEVVSDVARARLKAELLREELLSMGFTSAA